jgi:galactose mutarotase-like enzyme
MITLENDQLKVQVKTKGAELDSLYSKETNLEYLWNGDAKFWNKKSPILFPIVGTLKQNTYFYNNKAYILTRHGFARDKEFTINEQSENSATFTLTDDETTLNNFPFFFRLDVIYTLESSSLHVKYKITNTGNDNMFFSIGGHPAFKVPLEKKLDYHDYYLEFEQTEDAFRWLISSQGLIEPVTVPFLINTNILHITKDLFRNDALVFKYLNSHKVKLKSNRSKHGVEISYPGFPFLGLWAAPGADFICIEPWCGIADSTTSKQEFINKEGINLLTPSQVFERTWSVTVL